jgi:protein-S-isoprenylcysteine O-methyltransferase Ste14
MIPVFEIGIWNAWLFMIVFPLQWVAAAALPKRISRRIGHPAEVTRDRKDKVIGKLTELFWTGATLYSIFLPFRTGTAWFYTGLGIFTAGLLVLVLAMTAVIRTDGNVPFTSGIYRFSRHPMYLSMILIYLGVSIASASWLFLLITVITFVLQNFQMDREEEYCCSLFGKDYRDYMKRVPRWIGMTG